MTSWSKETHARMLQNKRVEMEGAILSAAPLLLQYIKYERATAPEKETVAPATGADIVELIRTANGVEAAVAAVAERFNCDAAVAQAFIDHVPIQKVDPLTAELVMNSVENFLIDGAGTPDERRKALKFYVRCVTR